jgi:hypothetical protein
LVGKEYSFLRVFQFLEYIIVQQAAAFFFSAVALCERDDIELYYKNIPFYFSQSHEIFCFLEAISCVLKLVKSFDKTRERKRKMTDARSSIDL